MANEPTQGTAGGPQPGQPTQPAYSPGLKGVIGGETAISRVTREGTLVYRGYTIEDLAAYSSYEEVAYLLLKGKLPNAKELKAFTAEIAKRRELPPDLVKTMKLFPKKGHPMDALRTATSYLGMQASGDLYKDSVDLLAKFPTIVANSYRLSKGKSYIKPKKEGSQAKSFLSTLTGKALDAKAAKVLDTTLVLYAEHGYNASTFCARVTSSTLSDLHAAITSGIGTLKGPLHGGANEKAMRMLLEVKSADRAEAYTLDRLQKKALIMGFGHREYKMGDPRARLLKKVAEQLLQGTKDFKWCQIADIVEKVMYREKQLYPNVDFPCSYVYYSLGIPIELYTPIFAVARIAGWSSHVMEQLGNNTLIRPECNYTGPENQQYVPLAKRS